MTVVGNSIGGWITVEMALIESPRISGIVLLDAVGIEVADQPVADFFTMGYDEFLERAFRNPDAFRMDPTSLPPAAQAAAAANRSALATYTGGVMNDPTLVERLGGLGLPTLVLWGDSDRIAGPEYGRAYANSIATARFQVLTDVGHLPQVESARRGASCHRGLGRHRLRRRRTVAEPLASTRPPVVPRGRPGQQNRRVRPTAAHEPVGGRAPESQREN